jgi:hypothetical protein
MRIIVLAWGSVVWDRRNLAIAGNFEPIGPRLPVEFCRVSRDGRLTLVIDESDGAECPTYAAPSVFDDLGRAIDNLWIREGSGVERPPKNILENGRIGFVDLVGPNGQSAKATERHPGAVAEIAAWVQANGFDAAIWTALGGNFDEPDNAGEPFSVDAAIRYLEARDALTLQKALVVSL